MRLCSGDCEEASALIYDFLCQADVTPAARDHHLDPYGMHADACDDEEDGRSHLDTFDEAGYVRDGYLANSARKPSSMPSARAAAS